MVDNPSDVITRIERHAAALTLAFHVHDNVHAQVAAGRLHAAVRRAAKQCTDGDCLPWLDAIARATDEAITKVARLPYELNAADVHRMLAWIDAMAPAATLAHRQAGPDLFHLDASSLDLCGMTLRHLHAICCTFVETRMDGGTLGATTFDRCDFSLSSLIGTAWNGAQLVDSSLVKSNLRDATIDHARFTRCDFRGADLTAERGSLCSVVRAAVFIECDLRETLWTHRDLNGVEFHDCKLYGVRGAPQLHGAEIVRPDLSPSGDGSLIGESPDAILSWCR